MSFTPQMERDSYKKMQLALKAFSRSGGLLKMTSEELRNMPKEVMIACAPQEIALVWNKLPEQLKNDIDVMKYQYCDEHWSTNSGDDEIDGPGVRKIFCCYCKMNDVNIRSEDCANTSNSLRRICSLDCLNCCKQQ